MEEVGGSRSKRDVASHRELTNERMLWQDSHRDADLDRELRSHLQTEQEELREQGIRPEEARFAANRSFGNIDLVKEDVRATWRSLATENLLQDIRYGLRNLLRAPGFTIAAVLTLAIGIGVNTAMFSVIHTVLLKQLPYRDPERLVKMWETHPTMHNIQASYPDFEDWRTQTHAFESMAAYSFEGWKKFNLVTRNGPEVVLGSLATPNLLPLMGIKPVLGRNFALDELTPGRDDVAMLGFRFWQQSFGGDPSILGTTIRVNGNSTLVIGILPDRREYPISAELILPISKLGQFDLTNRKHHQVDVVGRLKPAVTLQQASTEIDTISRRLQTAFPATNRSIGFGLEPLADSLTGDVRKPLWLLMGSVGLVLLIACVNVAHLSMARSTGRHREIAIRTALGASRRRLATQLLTESLVLALTGAAAGLLLATLAAPLLRSHAASRIPRLAELSIDPVVLAFTVGAALFTGLLFGTIPALRGSRAEQAEVLRASGSLSSQQRGAAGIRRMLVVTEIALAMSVVSGAGLLVRSFSKLLAVNPGFRTDHILTMRLPLQGSDYRSYANVQRFYDQLMPSLRGIPGVNNIATIDALPFRPGIATRFRLDGEPPPEPGLFPTAQMRTISPEYPRMMGIALRAGRAFTAADASPTAPPLCQINEAFAKRYYGDRSAVGRAVILGVLDPKPVALTIVGVLADTRGADLAKEADPTLYFPGYANPASLLISTSVDPTSLIQGAQRAIRKIDSEQPVADILTVQQILDESLARRRLSVTLLGGFSILALLLSATGLYAVSSYSVAQRTQEFGLRIALGASRAQVFRIVILESLRTNGFGLLLGLAGSVLTSRLLASLLFETRPLDPVTLPLTSILLCAAGMVGGVVPGLRAAAVDPMEAIRHD